MSAMTTRIDKSLVDAQMFNDLTQLCDGLADTFVFTCGWRSGSVEQAGYEKWLADPTQPKFTDPKNSAHVGTNFADGKSRAIDVTLIRGGHDVWDVTDAGWVAFIAAVKAHPRLHSLADIGDYDHVEKAGWRHDTIAA